MTETPNPIEIDGARPAVGWVSTLPREWITDRERLVLYVLAMDAYEETAAPGWPQLEAWAGLWHGQAVDVIRKLEQATDIRPALLERRDREGNVLPPGARNPGRERTRYRLRVDLEPVGAARPVGGAGPVERQPVGATGRGNRSGAPDRALPFPTKKT